MTTATQENKQTENAQESSDENVEKVVTFIANDFLKGATMVDLLSGVPVNTLIQLLQSQSIARAKKTVEDLSQEQFNQILDQVNNPQASEADLSEE